MSFIFFPPSQQPATSNEPEPIYYAYLFGKISNQWRGIARNRNENGDGAESWEMELGWLGDGYRKPIVESQNTTPKQINK